MASRPVLDLHPSTVVRRTLQPGRMFLVDTAQAIVSDKGIKADLAAEHPYPGVKRQRIVPLINCRRARRAPPSNRHCGG